MAARPEILFPLFADLKTLNGVGPKTAKHLEQIGVFAPRDLLFQLPTGVIDRRRRDTIKGAELPGIVTVEVQVTGHRPAARKGGAYRVLVEDAEDDFPIVFFHARGDYLKKLMPIGARRIVSGKLELFDGLAQMVHPDHVLPPEEAGELPEFEPIYPLTHGVTQKLMGRAAHGALALAPGLPEWIDPNLVKERGWPTEGGVRPVKQHHRQRRTKQGAEIHQAKAQAAEAALELTAQHVQQIHIEADVKDAIVQKA